MCRHTKRDLEVVLIKATARIQQRFRSWGFGRLELEGPGISVLRGVGPVVLRCEVKGFRMV